MRYSRDLRARQPCGRRTLTQQVLAILARYGSAANLYLPGIGAINGITAGNWLDSAGTTAATVDGQVGLVVSAAKEVGPELVTNGDFSNGATGWTRGSTGTQTIESGALRVAGDGTTTWSGISETTIPALTNGKQYLVQFSVLAENTSSGAGLYFRTSSLSIGGIFTNGLNYFYPSAVGNYSILYTATVDNINQLRIVAGSESNASVLFDNISVRELPGAHLTQSTAANQPILRRGLVNLLTQSDFQSGVTDAPTRGGLVTASTLAGYGGALAFGHDGTTLSFAYKSFTYTVGLTYTFAAVVAMDDGNAPTFAAVFDYTSSANSFALVTAGAVIDPRTITATLVSTGLYLVCGTYTHSGVGTNTGVVKYTTHSNRTFKVTRYGLFSGTVTAQQIIAAGGIPLTTTAAASGAKGNYWWQFDGSNDGLVLSQPVFTASNDDGFVCAGVTPNSVAGVQTVVASRGPIATPTNCANGLFMSSGAPLAYWEGGVATSLTGSAVPVGTPLVISAQKVGTAVSLRVNGTVAQSGTTSVNNATIANSAIGISLSGASNAPLLPGSHQIAAAVMCKGVVSEADAKLIERFVGSLSGVAL